MITKKKKILLMYISLNSGHHRASLAIEKAIRSVDPNTEILNINAFSYTNPILEKIVNKAYMGVIKRKPQIWEYLYDNPKVIKNTLGIRDLIHRLNSPKLKDLIDEFNPTAIACTQAFPCGMIADLKKTYDLSIPLFAVLTDFYPHFYWHYDTVDTYVVPSEKTLSRLVENDVDAGKIKVLGIPIDPKFAIKCDKEAVISQLGLSKDLPIVLMMGGGQGLGPIEEMITALEGVRRKLQLLIVSGMNKKLEKRLQRLKNKFRHKVLLFGYVDFINDLMDVSDFIITKPGGLTTSEALAKCLPMVIVDPIPGQEAKNARFLVEEGLALQADKPGDVGHIVEKLAGDTKRLSRMRQAAMKYSRPNAAYEVAKLIVDKK